jgi:hypothetical protein
MGMSESKKMTAEEAIKIAREYATRNGYDVDQYDTTGKLRDGEWHVFFKGKELLPGNFFSVFVDDESERVKELAPGK